MATSPIESWVVNEGKTENKSYGYGRPVLHRASCHTLKNVSAEQLTDAGQATVEHMFYHTGVMFHHECRKCIPEWSDQGWIDASVDPAPAPRRRRRI